MLQRYKENQKEGWTTEDGTLAAMNCHIPGRYFCCVPVW